MAIRVHQIMGAVDRFAPRAWAMDGDNVGLMVGRPDQVVTGVLVALDLTLEALAEAERLGANLIVTHHPAIYRSLSALRTDQPVGRVLANALTSQVAVFSAHTNLDVCPGGVSDRLASRLGLVDVEVLAPTGGEKLVKLVVYVPVEAADRVRLALGLAGAGHLGNYSHCAFESRGTGSFLPLEGASPYLGERGKLERIEEIRLETIVPERETERVVKAMLAAHPYEEVAYDLYPVKNEGTVYGLGRSGRLAEPMLLSEFALFVKEALGAPGVRAVGDPGRTVAKAAVMGGSGGSYIAKALFKGADVFVLGDLNYHDALNAADLGLALVDAGHGPTERVVLEALAEVIQSEIRASASPEVEVNLYRPAEEVFRFY